MDVIYRLSGINVQIREVERDIEERRRWLDFLRFEIDDEIKARALQIAMDVVDAMPAKYKGACMADAFYVACKEAKLPYGLKDIEAKANGLTSSEIHKAVEFIEETMGLTLPVADGLSYLVRFCDGLGMGTDDTTAAKKVFENFTTIVHPQTERLMAASIAYFMHRIATNQSIFENRIDSFSEIGSVAELSPATIRGIYLKKVLPLRSEILPALAVILKKDCSPELSSHLSVSISLVGHSSNFGPFFPSALFSFSCFPPPGRGIATESSAFQASALAGGSGRDSSTSPAFALEATGSSA